jgi:hypothetical protein
MPEPAESFRAGTLSRRIVAARDPRLLAVVQGLSYLASYPHGCLEQRVSRVYPSIMLKDLMESTGLARSFRVPEAAVRETFAFMESSQTEDGLFGFWPGSPGYVSMTAYTVEFLTACKAAGVSFDPKLLNRAVRALTAALRSDSSLLLAGYASYERVEALVALEGAGVFDEGYAGQLLNSSPGLPLYSQARLYTVLHKRGLADTKKAGELALRLESSIVTQKEGEREFFAGLQGGPCPCGGIVLGSELKTIAAIIEALLRANPASKGIPLLSNYLVSRAGENGWGNTQDNVAGIRIMKSLLTNSAAGGGEVVLEVSSPRGTRQLSTGGKGLAIFTLDDPGPVRVVVRKGASAAAPVALFLSADYVPTVRGSQVKADNAGFAVERELLPIGRDGMPANRFRAAAGTAIELPMDTVVEEHARVINFEDRNFVAVAVPIACGLEPLNPNLAGAPKEATPAGRLTVAPTYALYGDDAVIFYYDTLLKGTYDFFFRARASFSGAFSVPPARAELMYDLEVRGRSDGCELRIQAEPGS